MKTMQYLQMVNMQMLMKQHKGPSKDMAIDFDQGTEEIEIAGTEMIPEFGSGGTTITTIMVAETILAIILAGGKEMVLE
jgi:hypothetical protein